MALSRSSNQDELQDMINRGVASPGGSGGKAPAGRNPVGFKTLRDSFGRRKGKILSG